MSNKKPSEHTSTNVSKTSSKDASKNASKWNARHAFHNEIDDHKEQTVQNKPQAEPTVGKSKMSQIDTFEAMLAKGQDSDMLRYTLGNAYYKEKRLDEAAVHLQQAVILNPNYSTAWKLLGRVLGDAEKHQEALAAFDSGLAVAKNNGDKQVEKEIVVFRRRVEKKLSPPE